MESIEASGKNVEEAIVHALARLGRRRDEVEIAILQEASRGTFGLGSKEARVRVTARSNKGSSAAAAAADAVITPEMADAILGSGDVEIPLSDAEESDEGEEEEEYLEEGEEEEEEGEEEEDGEYDEEEEEDESVPFVASSESTLQPLVDYAAEAATGNAEIQDVEHPTREDIEITVDVLQHILRYMNIHATVQVRSTDPLTLNIRGINENLGLLIGRRGETLAALQLLVNLIVSHRTRHRMRIIVDAENYRERREENLRSLAMRVAQQVRNYRRSIALEAMPPYERRIVHIALADSKDISTESIGEGEERRVVISLKRAGR
ncbi:Jag N-terminal domain-containing protein [Ktedonobacteria bacterium brp13]|nr:Jag N-terminal domain-containing protein [Ktedonobacteria bacterium brp13]